MRNIDLSMFTIEEIEEIDAFKDLTEAMSINGEEIICFSLLSDIIHGNVSIKDISDNQLYVASRQLRNANEIFSGLSWFDSTLLETIEPKAQKLINDLIKY